MGASHKDNGVVIHNEGLRVHSHRPLDQGLVLQGVFHEVWAGEVDGFVPVDHVLAASPLYLVLRVQDEAVVGEVQAEHSLREVQNHQEGRFRIISHVFNFHTEAQNVLKVEVCFVGEDPLKMVVSVVIHPSLLKGNEQLTFGVQQGEQEQRIGVVIGNNQQIGLVDLEHLRLGDVQQNIPVSDQLPFRKFLAVIDDPDSLQSLSRIGVVDLHEAFLEDHEVVLLELGEVDHVFEILKLLKLEDHPRGLGAVVLLKDHERLQLCGDVGRLKATEAAVGGGRVSELLDSH